MFGYHEEQAQRARERQLVLLGAAMASKEWRDQMEGREFADARIGSAVNDVRGKGSPTRIDVRQVLHDLGVHEWEVTDGNPLSLLLEHVRMDARLAVVWRDIAGAIQATNAAQALTAAEKMEALQKTRRVVDEANRLLTEDAAQARGPSEKPCEGS